MSWPSGKGIQPVDVTQEPWMNLGVVNWLLTQWLKKLHFAITGQGHVCCFRGSYPLWQESHTHSVLAGQTNGKCTQSFNQSTLMCLIHSTDSTCYIVGTSDQLVALADDHVPVNWADLFILCIYIQPVHKVIHVFIYLINHSYNQKSSV